MITNERQYKISKAALAKLRKHIHEFNSQDVATQTGDALFAKAELQALESESEIIAERVAEYEALKSGSTVSVPVKSLEALPTALVQARIAQRLSQRALAERLGIKEQQIQRYEAERYASASLRRILEVASCLNLELANAVRLQAQATAADTDTKEHEFAPNRFPVREMYRRGWFRDFAGSSKEAENNADELLAHFLAWLGPGRSQTMHRTHVRAGGAFDSYALLAWECRIVQLAMERTVAAPYDPAVVTADWLRKLSALSATDDGPRLAVEYLAAAGITVVVEPHLQRTYLDGAALITGERPVIGMTLRYDRLDNFWFVLFHELAHLILHLRSGQTTQTFFDDLEAQADELEKQADDFASDALLSRDVWDASVARFFRTEENIHALASKLSVSPAIVAGRIRNEADNYIILNGLVGIGEVRKHFKEVHFGQ